MIQFTAVNGWHCQLNRVSRVFEVKHIEGEQASCHLSHPEIRLLERLLHDANTPVARKELTDFAWGGRPIAPGSLSHAIFNLRNAFGSADGHKIIQTVPNKGYRIHAQLLSRLPDKDSPVLASAGAPDTPASQTPPGSRPGLRAKVLTLSLAINLLLALGVYQQAKAYRQTTLLPTLNYTPIQAGTAEHYFAEGSVSRDGHLARAIELLRANPPSFTPARPFVYINAATDNGHYSYFLCDGNIHLQSARCGAYVIEAGTST